jgi:hypothetical protein
MKSSKATFCVHTNRKKVSSVECGSRIHDDDDDDNDDGDDDDEEEEDAKGRPQG